MMESLTTAMLGFDKSNFWEYLSGVVSVCFLALEL